MTQKRTQKGQFEPAGLGKLIEKQFKLTIAKVALLRGRKLSLGEI
jgi:hypothetical protein